MLKNFPVIGTLCVLSLLVLTNCARMSKIDYLRIYSRDGWQRPERIIEALDIKPRDSVADIGAGKGYFTRFLSDAVGPTGRVYAVEIGGEEIAALNELAAEDGRANIQVIEGRPEDPFLPSKKLDLVFLLNTYHHIDDRPRYFSRVRETLKPDGQLAIVDIKDDLTGILRLFTSECHWSSKEQIRTELAVAGFRLLRSYDFLPLQNFEILMSQERN
jgi:predicted methyltransferase